MKYLQLFTVIVEEKIETFRHDKFVITTNRQVVTLITFALLRHSPMKGIMNFTRYFWEYYR